jgi:hypothetical protein
MISELNLISLSKEKEKKMFFEVKQLQFLLVVEVIFTNQIILIVLVKILIILVRILIL